MVWDSELEAFKEIDLRQYAAEFGYALDRRESWRGSAVMRQGADKVVIKRDSDGHYVYFSVRDDRDNGSIIDFVQNRKRLSLGEVRKELRPWIGRTSPLLTLFPPLQTTAKDRLQVETGYECLKDTPRHPYLIRERRIPADLLASGRFAGRIRIDARGNAVFPHFDEDGLCGYELKNRNFTGFAPGGEKGLWMSHERDDDNCLVLAESAIDGLSYAALHPDSRARYASIGGTPNPKQPGLITAEILRLPAGSSVVSAMDNDKAGHTLSHIIAAAVRDSGRHDLSFVEDLPARAGDDWNDVLKNGKPPAPSAVLREGNSVSTTARPVARRPSALKPPGF